MNCSEVNDLGHVGHVPPTDTSCDDTPQRERIILCSPPICQSIFCLLKWLTTIMPAHHTVLTVLNNFNAYHSRLLSIDIQRTVLLVRSRFCNCCNCLVVHLLRRRQMARCSRQSFTYSLRILSAPFIIRSLFPYPYTRHLDNPNPLSAVVDP